MNLHSWSRTAGAGVALATVLVAGGSALADPGPTIDHQPVKTAPAHVALEIRAHIVSNSTFPVYKPTLYVRPAGMTSFTRIDLVPLKGVPDIYTAVIPADLITDSFDYYLEAFDKDGNGPSNAGTGAAPLHVAVTASGPPPLVVNAGTGTPAPSAAPNGVTAPAPAPSSSGGQLAGEALMGGGGAVAITGAILLGAGASYASTVSTDKTTYNLALSGPQSAATNLEIAGGALLGAGVIAAGVGLYLFFSSDSGSSSGAKAADRTEAERHPKLASLLLDF